MKKMFILTLITGSNSKCSGISVYLYLIINALDGPIPVGFENSENIVGIYLANNSLTGPVPEGKK